MLILEILKRIKLKTHRPLLTKVNDHSWIPDIMGALISKKRSPIIRPTNEVIEIVLRSIIETVPLETPTLIKNGDFLLCFDAPLFGKVESVYCVQSDFGLVSRDSLMWILSSDTSSGMVPFDFKPGAEITRDFCWQPTTATHDYLSDFEINELARFVMTFAIIYDAEKTPIYVTTEHKYVKNSVARKHGIKPFIYSTRKMFIDAKKYYETHRPVAHHSPGIDNKHLADTLVRGFFRQQRYGYNLEKIKTVWVAPFMRRSWVLKDAPIKITRADSLFSSN